MTQFKVTIEGPNGCGKTTFINEIMSMYKWKEKYKFEVTGHHEVTVTPILKAMPDLKEDKDD